jgi:hypothetical protein
MGTELKGMCVNLNGCMAVLQEAREEYVQECNSPDTRYLDIPDMLTNTCAYLNTTACPVLDLFDTVNKAYKMNAQLDLNTTMQWCSPCVQRAVPQVISLTQTSPLSITAIVGYAQAYCLVN